MITISTTQVNLLELDTETKRAIWHSRRGMLELDVLLVPFAEKYYALLDDAEKQVYRRLIDCEDPDLFTWFLEHQVPDDEELAAMVVKVKQSANPRG